MEILELDREKYSGKKFTIRYKTNGYYDIYADEHGFQMRYIPFEAPAEKSFDDVLLGEWLENPVAFGAFENGKMFGYVEGSLESWNNRFRISNIGVFDESRRNSGLGTMLMDTIIGVAKSLDARMVVLETQSCNEKAISFYKKNGFEIIGFDLYAYSNIDAQRHEVRVEMGMKLK